MASHNVVRIIENKSKGLLLSSEEIDYFVKCVSKNEIDEAQIGAFLMAIKLKGMNGQETANLTKSMADYSEKFNWSQYDWYDKVVDKHSTGGVGDKISHILAPILSACGLKMPMISGRGLGITGGTIDKLEAIKGFFPLDDLQAMPSILEDSGFFITGQTNSMVPVDKRLYAIRDVTATVDSIPLITASILSKKKIEDIRALLMDVKFGEGTFMKTEEEAVALAESMIETGKSLDMDIVCLIDDMNSPLGYCIGNALEIAEVLRALHGEMSPDIKEIIHIMAHQLLKFVNKNSSNEEIAKKIDEAISSGKALESFKKMLKSQGVKELLADSLCVRKILPIASYMELLCDKKPHVTEIPSDCAGFVTAINAEKVGIITRDLGGGRVRKEDKLNYGVGVELICKEGDFIERGKPWAKVYHENDLEITKIEFLKSAITVKPEKILSEIRVKKILHSLK